MILDSETLALANAIEAVLEEYGETERRQARAARAGARDRHQPHPNTAAAGGSCASCGGGQRGGRAPRAVPRLGRHAPVRDVGGPAGVLAPALPRADRRPALRRAPGDHLRPARARRPRRPREGDPRRQRHARARADPVRAGRQLAVLARRRHRLRLDPDADLPRLPARRHPALLRGLGRLRAPDRLHGRLRRDRGLHVPLVRRAPAPELRHRRDPRDGRADAGRAHAGARGAHPGDGQGAGRALRGGQAAGRYPYEMLDENKWLAARHGMEGELVDLPERRLVPAKELARRLYDRCASTRRTSARPPSSRRSRTSSTTATARTGSAWSTRPTTTTPR